MEITIGIVRSTVILLGILVLASYVWGVSKMSSPKELWGGIPSSWQKKIIPFMFLAAIGFLVFWWITMYSLSVEELKQLRYPWSEDDNMGLTRMFWAYVAFLIPSMLWLESTRFHERTSYSWTPYLVTGVLTCATFGNILLLLLGYSAYQQAFQGGDLMLLGMIALAYQVIINDLVLWTYKYPWSPESLTETEGP